MTTQGVSTIQTPRPALGAWLTPAPAPWRASYSIWEAMMAHHDDININVSSGNDTEGLEISADLAEMLWPSTSNGQRVTTLRDNVKLLLTIWYVIQTGKTLAEATQDVDHGTTEQH